MGWIPRTELLLYTLLQEKGLRGKMGKEAHLEKWISTISSLSSSVDTEFSTTFEWNYESMGVPGAFIIQNHHHTQFYLKSLTLEDIPGHGPVQFVCNSWVYPAHRYKYQRVFFSNKVVSVLIVFSFWLMLCKGKSIIFVSKL